MLQSDAQEDDDLQVQHLQLLYELDARSSDVELLVLEEERDLVARGLRCCKERHDKNVHIEVSFVQKAAVAKTALRLVKKAGVVLTFATG